MCTPELPYIIFFPLGLSINRIESQNGPVALTTTLPYTFISSSVTISLTVTPIILFEESFMSYVTLAWFKHTAPLAAAVTAKVTFILASLKPPS